MLPSGPHDFDPKDVFKPSRAEKNWPSWLVTLIFYLAVILLGLGADLSAGKHWLLTLRNDVRGTLQDGRPAIVHFSAAPARGDHRPT